ncbi:MAG: cobalt ECF transporter T component CbiQ [Clostridium sp.]
MNGIDRYSYCSKIRDINPRDKLCLSLFPLFICICISSFSVSIITILIMAFLTIRFSGIGYKKYIYLLMIPLGFLILGSIGIMINTIRPGEIFLLGVSVGEGVYGITEISLFKGINIILRSIGAISCMYFLSLNTTMNSLFIFLRRTKLPVLIIELMELMYRFVFILWEEGRRIYIAQSSRLGYEGFRNKISSSSELISVLFIRAFKRVDRINLALESRGFSGGLNTIAYETRSSKKLYIYTILISIFQVCIYFIERLVF